MDMVALPFCQITLKAQKPKKIINNPNTIEEHIRKRRLKLNLFQFEVAQIIGVNRNTLNYWETNHNQPTNRNMPKINDFLGYIVEDYRINNFGSKLVWYRKSKGLSQKEFEKILKIDKTTLSRWERNKNKPVNNKFREILERSQFPK